MTTYASHVTVSASPPPQVRGVYKLRVKVLGRNAYYALTSTIQFVNGTLYVSEGDRRADAALAKRLFEDLDRAEPRRPRLEIVGRSGAEALAVQVHGEITQIELGRGQVIAIETMVPNAFADDSTRDVFESLFRGLYGIAPGALRRPIAQPERDHYLDRPQ